MIATVDSSTPAVAPTRGTRARPPRKAGDQATRPAAAPVAKSKDPGMTKVSLYLPVPIAKKLDVAAIIRDESMSDIVATILARELSSVTFYDRATRPLAEALTVTEIDRDRTAD
jgi:hypothetical protein